MIEYELTLTGEEKKEILEQARARILEIESLREFIMNTESWVEARPAKMQHAAGGGGGRLDKLSSAAVNLINASERMNKALIGISEKINIALDIIDSLPESIDRVIFTEFYLNGKTWPVVSEIAGYTQRNCAIRRNKALGISTAGTGK